MTHPDQALRERLARWLARAAGADGLTGYERSRADALLAELAAAGYVVVPVEPSENMLIEGGGGHGIVGMGHGGGLP